MSKLFVSYARESKVAAEALANDIRTLGHIVWFDQELAGGQAWWNQILENIRNCDVFVFVLTPQSLNSVACMREYAYAAALSRLILPILVVDGVSINLLPPALSQIQFVDYRDQNRSSALRLARGLSSACRTCAGSFASAAGSANFLSWRNRDANRDPLDTELPATKCPGR